MYCNSAPYLPVVALLPAPTDTNDPDRPIATASNGNMNGNRHHVGDQPLNEQEYDNNEIVRDSESAAVDLSLLSTQMRYIFAAWRERLSS